MKLYRIIFPVADIEIAAKFYSHIFEQDGNRVSPGRHYFNLEGTILALYDPKADGDPVNEQWKFHENQYIYIATNNLITVHQKFLESGCHYVDKEIQVMPWGERLFYAIDISGNPVCFVDDETIFTG